MPAEAGGESPRPVRASRAQRTRDDVRRTPGARPHGRIVQFVRECWAELHKVQWPNRPQLWQATLVVLVFCTVLGFYIFALDSVLLPFSKWLVRQYSSSH